MTDAGRRLRSPQIHNETKMARRNPPVIFFKADESRLLPLLCHLRLSFRAAATAGAGATTT
jgi:hypothetical protein